MDSRTNDRKDVRINNYIWIQNHGNHRLDIQPERSILRVGQNL